MPNIGYGDGGVSKVKGRLLFVPVRELGGLVAGWVCYCVLRICLFCGLDNMFVELG